MKTSYAAAATVCLSLAIAFAENHAAAHPLVEDGHAQIDQGDFEEALATFDRAVSGQDLSREDLVEVLVGRALVYMALRQIDAVENELRTLAALSPDHQFGPHLPPDLADAFAELRRQSPGPIAVRVDTIPRAGGVRIDPSLVNNVESLVRSIRVRARTEGGPWIEGTSTLWVPAAPGVQIDYEVALLGPGAAVLTEANGRTAAARISLPDSAPATERAAPLAPTPLDAAETSDGTPVWPWVAAGAAVVAATTIVVAFVVTADASTQPSYPVVR